MGETQGRGQSLSLLIRGISFSSFSYFTERFNLFYKNMKKLLFLLFPVLIFAGCTDNSATTPEQKAISELDLKEKCNNYATKFANEYASDNLIAEPDALLIRQSGYSSKLNTCLVYLENFRVFDELGIVTHELYDSFSGEYLLDAMEQYPHNQQLTKEERETMMANNKTEVKDFKSRVEALLKK